MKTLNINQSTADKQARLNQINALATQHGREIRCIAQMSGRSLPKITISGIYTLDLFQLQQRILSMAENDIIVIGRNLDCDIVINSQDRRVSRIHCYLLKTKNQVKLFDCSLNGTQIIF